MPPAVKYYAGSLFFLCCFLSVCSQSSLPPALRPANDTVKATTGPQIIIINEIFISGNKKTKSFIISRELPFKKGDTTSLAQLLAGFRRAKELLFNTRLFNEVVVSVKSFHGYRADIQVDVKERWYLFPVPYFRPVDRNLSAWAERNYSLSRVNYGIKFLHNNFTGRNDRLRMWLLGGYTRQVQLNYDQPAADKSLKHGYGFGLLYAALKEINISTNHNEQTFLNTDSLPNTGKYLLKQAAFSLNYFYRPALSTRHLLRLTITHLQTDSLVRIINPKYLNTAAAGIWYPELSYTLEYQKVDYAAYVLKGFMGDLNFTRRGIFSDMNLSQFTGRFTKGWPLGNNFYAGLQGYGTIKLPFDQPYYNQRLFGYGDIYLRGLEKYVVDGVAGGMARTTLRKHVYSFQLNGGRLPTLQTIPFAMYVKVYGDMGYAYNKTFLQNSLVNKMLYSAGAGIDVVSAYDFIFRCEYSFNQLGQSGFFFHIRNDF